MLAKKETIIITFIACMALSLMYITYISARTWTPGVTKGDFFYYETYGVYTASTPKTTIDIPSFEYNNTEWIRINITEISGSIVNQIYTLHFNNGTETNFDLQTNLDPTSPDNLSFSGKGIPICVANLNVGDSLSTVPLTINDTSTRTYASGSRKTNHVTWNTSDDCGDCYFDRDTGMLVETYRVHKFTNQGTGDTVEKADVINMINTNRWKIKDASTQTSILPFIIALIIATLVFLAIVIKKAGSLKTRI